MTTLQALVELAGKATAGEWVVPHPDNERYLPDVCTVEGVWPDGHAYEGEPKHWNVATASTGREEAWANAAFIAAACNFVRSAEFAGLVAERDALRKAIRTIIGDIEALNWEDADDATVEAIQRKWWAYKRDAERYRWLRSGDNDELVMRTYADNGRQIGGVRPFDPRFDNSFLLRNEKLDAAIDTASGDAEGAGGQNG